jgi:preprotein translocase subunit YajC
MIETFVAVGPPAFLLQGSPGALQNPLIPVILMVIVFYLVLFLPMRRRQKKLDEMLRNLSTGDKVVTTGGVIGVVVGIAEKAVTLRVKPDNVKLEFARSAVVGTAEPEEETK